MAESILVLGLGKSGIAVARHAIECGASVTIYAGASSEATREAAREFEDDALAIVFDSEDVAGSYDLCVVSPGIPQTGAFYASAAAASREIISEPEYAWRISPKSWIAVTGTNGKTTTTSLVAYVLQQSGLKASACGNIGDTALAAVEARGQDETLVVEMSSYQLASTRRFSPDVAILLNITPDHISWHGSFDAYAQAKFKVFANMHEGGFCIVSDSVIDAYPAQMSDILSRGARVISVGSKTGADCAYCDALGILCVDLDGKTTQVVNAGKLKIKGTHNIENALCAAAACLALGLSVDAVADALRSFMPLEHRIEPCGQVGDISFFNDSKATNVDATLKALTAFSSQRIVLLLGGRDKGTDLRELVGACTGVASAVVAYGEAGERIYSAFENSSVPVYREAGMRDAFSRACDLARPGQAVVLSPACASFDEFDSFEQRGSVFKSYVDEYIARMA